MKQNPKAKLNQEKPIEKRSIIAKIITNIIMFFMKGTIKRLDSMIDPERGKALMESQKALENEVDKYNELLERPDIKEEIEGSGKSVEDFRLDKL